MEAVVARVDCCFSGRSLFTTAAIGGNGSAHGKSMPVSRRSRSSSHVADRPGAYVGLSKVSTGLRSRWERRQEFSAAFDQATSQCRRSPSAGTVTMMPIGTPRVPYRTPGEGGWQWVDIWNVLYRERIIFLGENIDEDFGNQVLATMLFLDSIDSNKTMWLYINGPGGDLTPCLALYDTMESIKSPVGSLAMGYAYNMAGFLLAAGAKGSRLAMPMSRVALQAPAGAAGGTATDLKNEADELLRVKDYIFKELAKKTGQPLEKIEKDLSRMKRFNSEEALEYGIIDRILRPPRLKSSIREDGVRARL